MILKLLTSLEITDTHIKLVQSRIVHGQPVIQACDMRRIDPPSEEQCVKILSGLVTIYHMRTQPLLIIVPRRMMILRYLNLPSHDEPEIQKMVNLQLADKIPYSREDVVYDYVILKKEENGYSKVLITLLHRDVVQRYLKLLEKIGVSPAKITLSSSGLAAWWAYRHKKHGQPASVPTVLINIDEIDSEICFCVDDRFIFSRQIQLGARDLNAQHMDQFVNQIDVTLKSYVKDNMGPDVEHFVLVSPLQEVNLLKERLQTALKKDVEVCSPLEDLPASVKNQEHMSLWERSGYSAAVGIGVALGKAEDFLNLLPTEVMHSKAQTAGRKRWFTLAVLSGIIFILSAGIFSLDTFRQQTGIQQIQERVKSLKPEVARSESIIKLVEFADQKILQQVTVTDVLAALYELTPSDIAFRSLHISEQGLVTINGFSQSRTSVSTFQNQLVNSAMFENVTLQYASRSRMIGQELTDFKIAFQIAQEKGPSE